MGCANIKAGFRSAMSSGLVKEGPSVAVVGKVPPGPMARPPGPLFLWASGFGWDTQWTKPATTGKG